MGVLLGLDLYCAGSGTEHPSCTTTQVMCSPILQHPSQKHTVVYYITAPLGVRPTEHFYIQYI